jgi:cytosine/creatinine deaminase
VSDFVVKVPATRSPYYHELAIAIEASGGHFNAHLHLDRAGTYHETLRLLTGSVVQDATSLTLAGKHALIPLIHESSQYDPSNLDARVSFYLDEMIRAGTRRADTVVDTTLDRVRLRALHVFAELKDRYCGRLDLRIGAYSPLGFRDDEPARWELLEEGAKLADFVGLLPERDDKQMYPDHIGFRESCMRAIALSRSLGKGIHIHVDQANHQNENGTETVLDVLDELGGSAPVGDPDIWLIHLISPSTYDEVRFNEMRSRMAELNVGVITCPSAAISMRQYRGLMSPTYNSIARVLELLEAGVHVRMGSDNICDVTSPTGTPDLMDEVFVLSNALRFYDVAILAKIASGSRLDKSERMRIRAHLENDRMIAEKIEAAVRATLAR